LITTDNLEFPAFLKSAALKKVSNSPEFVQSPNLQIWRVYPRTLPTLQFALIRTISSTALPTSPEINEFKITGELTHQSDKNVILRIYRSPQPRTAEQAPPSFTLKLNGSLPSAELGQIWQIHALRVGRALEIQAAKLIGASTNLEFLDRSQSKPSTAERKTSSRFFHVYANGQTFVGKHSVSLKDGILLIDNQPVVETKTATVKGPVTSIEADIITPSRNELILTSH